LLYLGLFAHRARVLDASATALDPELVRLRGKSPLVLVPIANPQNAPAMVAVAQALAPPEVGRVLLLSVVTARPGSEAGDHRERIAAAQAVLRESLTAAFQLGVVPEALVTVAADPMAEIARVARSYRCQGMLVGSSDLAADERGATPLEGLLSGTDTDIVVLRAPLGWQLAGVQRVLVPVGGRGVHEQLLAQLLGSLLRTGNRRFTFLRVVPRRASAGDRKKARRLLAYLAEGEVGRQAEIEIVASDTPEEEVARQADASDLVILGVQRLSRRYKLLGGFTRRMAQLTNCPIIAISSRG
jgi:basic amino acid/polyamine antiporter, APA family